MTSQRSTKFPWIGFLLRSIGWSLLVMLILGALFRYFTRDLSIEGISAPEGSKSLFAVFWRDFITTLIFLLPSFYAGMGACVLLERREDEFQNQFQMTFRLVSGIVFLIIFSVWAYQNLIPMSEMTVEDGFNTFRLVLVFYIFDGNVSDEVWAEIFSKRKGSANQSR